MRQEKTNGRHKVAKKGEREREREEEERIKRRGSKGGMVAR